MIGIILRSAYRRQKSGQPRRNLWSGDDDIRQPAASGFPEDLGLPPRNPRRRLMARTRTTDEGAVKFLLVGIPGSFSPF
jgi:hypothetical protein